MAKYYIKRSYAYNVFGADEHLVISLYKDTGKKYLKYVDSWAYSTFLSPRVAKSRGDAKIRSLRSTYGAELM